MTKLYGLASGIRAPRAPRRGDDDTPTPAMVAQAMQVIRANKTREAQMLKAQNDKLAREVFGDVKEQRRRYLRHVQRKTEALKPPVRYLQRADWDR